MKVPSGVLTFSLGLAALVAVPAATAQNSYYYAGQATGGQPLMVDLGSIVSSGEYDANFNYAVGEELVASKAHCVGGGAWTTLSDGVVHYAQSQATREMVRIVCSYSGRDVEVADGSNLPTLSVEPTPSASVDPLSPARIEPLPAAPIDIVVEPAPSLSGPSSMETALVYDPSSNVRATPNGRILCSIDTRAYINIYGRFGDWYDTDACGSLGVIHISQIQF